MSACLFRYFLIIPEQAYNMPVRASRSGAIMRVTFTCSAAYAPPLPEMMERVMDFILGLDTSTQHENVNIIEGGDYISACLFFVDDPVLFDFAGGRLRVSVDSTLIGPGYHAAMVNMVEFMAESLGFAWDDEDARDVTGYWRHRDFKRLQQYMTAWLIDYAGELTGEPGPSLPARTSPTLPHAVLPGGDRYFACHTLGCIHKEFFLNIREHDDPELFSRSFFIWWNLELDAEFYLKCALHIIWCRLNWLPPVLENEMLDVSNALLELEIAWRMNKSLPLPVPEWFELAGLTGDKELTAELIRRFPTGLHQPPARGYRRHNIIHNLGDGRWRIQLPGKLHCGNDDDGSLIFWDHADRNIRITIASRRDAHGRMIPAQELLGAAMTGLTVAPHLLPGHPRIPAFISHSEVAEGNRRIFKTTLFAALEGSLAIVSIYYAGREEKAWAVAVCDSLAPGPGGGET